MNPRDFDAIIFDFDGVLVESVDVKTRAFASMYSQHGEKVVARIADYHLRHGGMSRFDKFRHFQTAILGRPPPGEQEVAKLAEQFSQRVVEQVVAAPMVRGAQAFLDACLGTIPLFVVSGTPTAELIEILERRNLGKYFAGTWGSPASKTDNIAALLRDHELDARRCVMIGDAMADYEGAAANTVHFLGRVAGHCENIFPPQIETFADFSSLPAQGTRITHCQ